LTSHEELAGAFLAAYPEAAARLLESMEPAAAGGVLAEVPQRAAASTLHAMLPTAAARCAEQLPTAAAVDLLEQLSTQACAAILRHLTAERRIAVLADLGPAQVAAAKLLLSYPANTIGAWIEPRVLTLAEDATVSETLKQAQRAGQLQPRIYVLDRRRRVRGAVRGATLFAGSRRSRLTALLEPAATLWAREPLTAAQEHEIWDHESEAPVVNREEEFIGVVSYADLRRAFRELTRAQPATAADRDVAAFAELFLSGLESTWQSLGELLTHQSTR
jgi:Mg/Co/Ni transporter MgtE